MGSWRKAVGLTLLSLLTPALCVTTAWADVTDPCDSAAGPGSYQNLAPADRDYIGWDDPPDQSYLCQQSNSRTATAVYRCENASAVTVAIYSRHGSYAGYSDGELIRGGDQLPLWYQSSTGEVYCDGRRMVYDADRRMFAFLEEEDRPSGLVEYGLSVYGSRDGTDYEKVSSWLVSAEREGPDAYWYEVYRAYLEEGTRYLRLVLTDQSSIEIPGREERYRFETTGGLALASVEIIEEEEEAPAEPPEEDEEPTGNRDLYFEDGFWSGGNDQGTDSLVGTEDLPSYQPGEEQGPESLPWGPEEDPADGGPAFPEELEDQDPEEEPSQKEPSSSGSSSSSSSKAQSRQSGSSSRKAQEGASSGSPQSEEEPAAAAAPAPVQRRDTGTSLWRRVTQPDAMTMVIIAITLLVMGLRILWEDGNGSQKTREQEERYLRYMDQEGRNRRDRTLPHTRHPRRRNPVRWDDEDDDWNSPDNLIQ